MLILESETRAKCIDLVINKRTLTEDLNCHSKGRFVQILNAFKESINVFSFKVCSRGISK